MNHSVPKELNKVMKAYGWGSPYHLVQNKHTWYASTERGVFFLKRTQMEPQKLQRVQQILEKAREEGYKQLLPFIHTKSGEGMVAGDRGQWYATPWKQPSDRDLKAKELIQSLATLHRYTEPLARRQSEFRTQVDDQWLHQWNERRQQSSKVKSWIKEKEYPSPFDQSLHRYHEMIDRSLSFAIRGIQKYMKLENGKPPRYTLCHNRIHPSNIVQDAEGFYWVDFDHASFDSPVRDLATFIRRFSHQSSPDQLLEIYEEEFPLYPKEKKLLAIYLAYPATVLKTISNYYDGVSVSDESTYQKQLEQDIERLAEIQKLVVDLWSKKANR